MQFSFLKTLSLFAVLHTASATWELDFYESGCPAPGGSPETPDIIAGKAGQELSCVDSSPAHNIVVTGIEADGMVVTLFSDKLCTAVITTIDTDGCKVIAADTVISTARIVPK